MSIVVQGRSAFAALLRLLADMVDDGSLIYPPAIYPAHHLGPFAVRIGGIDLDLAAGLPGVDVPGDDDETTPVTAPGKGRKKED